MTTAPDPPPPGPPLLERVAGAPISWAVCEVPGWGYEPPPEQVLGTMHELGLRATELGPQGYLPVDADRLRELLGRYELRAIAGFVPLVLHVPERLDAATTAARTTAARLAAAGAEVLVVAATAGTSGYGRRAPLDEDGWAALATGVERLEQVAADAGLHLAVHPHAGTMIATRDDVELLLDRTSAELCLDTGHLIIGGADPYELVRRAGRRVRHVHLKDVERGLVDALNEGRVDFLGAVRRGVFQPLGRGDAPIAPTLRALEEIGYDRWYVVEQDRSLPEQVTGEAPPGTEELDADMRTSLDFLRVLQRQLGTATDPHAAFRRAIRT